MVIDEIANYELFEVLYSRKPVVIINEMWRGKYENDIFMKYSLCFRIVRAILIKNNDFVHYYPNFIDEFKSLYWLLKPKSKECIYHLDKKQKAHMFMFKSWKSSMNLRYILDAIFILIIAVVIQIQISKFQNQAVSYYSILGDYNTKKNALLDTTLTASQRTAAQTAFNEIELKFLNINNNAYDKLILIYYMNLILLAYFFRNICQVIFAKLRNKSWMYIKEDLLMSLVHLFLTFLIFYRHYAIYQYQNPADPRYYNHNVNRLLTLKQIFFEKNMALIYALI